MIDVQILAKSYYKPLDFGNGLTADSHESNVTELKKLLNDGWSIVSECESSWTLVRQDSKPTGYWFDPALLEAKLIGEKEND